MNEFIKQNWFKIIITIAIIVIILLCAYYIFFTIPSQKIAYDVNIKTETERNNKEKCAKEASAFFHSHEYDTWSLPNFSNHYNQKLNKCFIKIDSFGSIAYNTFLIDVYEGKTYGSFNQKKSDSIPVLCNIINIENNTPKTCNSEKEFNALVKPYMEN